MRTLFIEPRNPWENGYTESFNGKLRDKGFNREIFDTVLKAKVLRETWRREYNRVRPHSPLGYRPPLLTTKPFLKHETLIREGERGQEMFMIARGAVQVFRGNRDEPQVLATLKAGDILGEMSLLSDEPRVASAVTTTHGSALVLRKKDFQKFLDQNPQLRRRIKQLYEEWLAIL